MTITNKCVKVESTAVQPTNPLLKKLAHWS